MARQTSHVIVQPTTPGPQKPARPRDPVASGERDAAHNRVASHNYFLLEKFEAGVALRGTEVKSIREGKANLKDSYGLIQNGEAFLLNVHIGPYSHGNMANHDATRTRKLLLHREEVRKLLSKTQIKGHTLIPTRLYFRNGRVKCELAVANAVARLTAKRELRSTPANNAWGGRAVPIAPNPSGLQSFRFAALNSPASIADGVVVWPYIWIQGECCVSDH
jgi:SsrA-binding protein